MNTVMFDSHPVMPSKILCIGRNYVDHVKELANAIPDEPVIFIKPNSSISQDVYSQSKDAIHYEAEISFIIENEKLAGVGFGLDLTKRDLQAKLQAKGLPWERAKAFDKAAVFSQFTRFAGDISTLNLKLLINDAVVQQAGVAQMIHKPDFVLNEIKSSFSLQDGDIIMTGTPKGTGTIKPGQKFIGQIYEGQNLLVEQQWQVK